MVQESHRYDDSTSRKAQKIWKRGKRPDRRGEWVTGVTHAPPWSANGRPSQAQPSWSASRASGVLGTPLPPFTQLRSVTFDVSFSLDSQTTSKSDETRSNIFIVGRPTLKIDDGLRITLIRRKDI